MAQGVASISDATEEWEKMLRAGEVEHFGNPILSWMNSNCLAVRKEAGTRIEKNSKVLGIYACINAIAQWKAVSAGETDDQLIESW
jgi:phage terminase large subunit-like protein